jgi:hypothetical protein
MQDHRTAPDPTGVARPFTQEHEHQRRLVLELAVEPPIEGDHPVVLARTLGYSVPELEAAAEALIAAGLAERRDGRLFASRATRALDVLWPIAL